MHAARYVQRTARTVQARGAIQARSTQCTQHVCAHCPAHTKSTHDMVCPGTWGGTSNSAVYTQCPSTSADTLAVYMQFPSTWGGTSLSCVYAMPQPVGADTLAVYMQCPGTWGGTSNLAVYMQCPSTSADSLWSSAFMVAFFIVNVTPARVGCGLYPFHRARMCVWAPTL